MFNDIIRGGNQLVMKGYGSEAFSNDLAQINEGRRKYTSDVPELIEELDKLGKDLTEIHNNGEEMSNRLAVLEVGIEGLKTVGSDAESINSQMEQIKVEVLLFLFISAYI